MFKVLQHGVREGRKEGLRKEKKVVTEGGTEGGSGEGEREGEEGRDGGRRRKGGTEGRRVGQPRPKQKQRVRGARDHNSIPQSSADITASYHGAEAASSAASGGMTVGYDCGAAADCGIVGGGDLSLALPLSLPQNIGRNVQNFRSDGKQEIKHMMSE
jgi:hypothetical protein